ncbi:MAG: helix-turn-helix transcriptional regulator [Casimicrobiaceae bacterium]
MTTKAKGRAKAAVKPKARRASADTNDGTTAAKATRAPRGRRAGQTRLRVSAATGITHVTPVGGNVFADLGFPQAEARNLLVRSELMSALQRLIKGMTQAEAAVRLGIRQPRVSDLMHDRIDRFTIDALINMLDHAGGEVRIVVKAPKQSAA